MDSYTSSSGILLTNTDPQLAQQDFNRMASSILTTKGSANRSKSLANLNAGRLDEAAAASAPQSFIGTLKNRRWRAMASGISSIRRLVNPGRATATPCVEERGDTEKPAFAGNYSPTLDGSEVGFSRSTVDIHTSADELGNSTSVSRKSLLVEEPALHHASTSDLECTANNTAIADGVSLSVRDSCSPVPAVSNGGVLAKLSAAERFWTMRRNGKASSLESKGKESDARVRIVQGLTHCASDLPVHAVCVNPYFLAYFHGTAAGKQETGSVFLTQPFHILHSYPASPQPFYQPPSSCSPVSRERSGDEVLSPPPSYEDMTSHAGDRNAFSSASFDHMRSESDGSCSGHANTDTTEQSDSSSACSFSSTSCATWSHNPTPAHRQCSSNAAQSDHSSVCRLSSSSPVPPSSYSRRELPPLPPSQPALHACGSFCCDSDATVSPISPSSSTSSLDELEERSHLLENYDMLKQLNWYWGPLSREQSEDILMKGKYGDVLLRDSNNHTHFFVLSVLCHTEVLHILTDNKQLDMEWLDSEKATFSEILHYLNPKITLNKHGQSFARSKEFLANDEVLLLQPLVRYTQVPSLQHLCRLVVRGRCLVHRDDVAKMELPAAMKTFLNEPNVFPNPADLP